MVTVPLRTAASRWELAAEAIAVKIRWFGLVVGYVLVNFGSVGSEHGPLLNAILSLGAGYALLDTVFSLRGKVFLGHYPLVISSMEALFIGLLCFFGGGLESLFRNYYLLSLICCAIRHPSRVTYVTCVLHSVSYTVLWLAVPPQPHSFMQWMLTLVMLGWVTWASDAMALLLKRVGEHLGRLNVALTENQAHLESRIAERTRQLQESQAHVLHQEKMAAFGLLAAGIAHEVGNPLTSISSLVQMLQRRDYDEYTREKLNLVNGQLQRIQSTLRELINFSRPASTERTRVSIGEMLQEARNIAKYSKHTKGKSVSLAADSNLPAVIGVRDQLVQVFLNLMLNAIEAAGKDGRIEITAKSCREGVEVRVSDNGCGIAPEHLHRVFEPYFTTKKHGTGLGLFVTHKLVTDHGGTIAFESSPGTGSVFRIHFSAAPERASPTGECATVAESPAW